MIGLTQVVVRLETFGMNEKRFDANCIIYV